MPQLHDASFLLQCRGIEKTLSTMVMSQCNVTSCRANGIKQEEEGGVASLHTICSSFWSSVVNILKKMAKAGEGFHRELQDLSWPRKHLIKGMGNIIVHYCQDSHLLTWKEISESKILWTSRKIFTQVPCLKTKGWQIPVLFPSTKGKLTHRDGKFWTLGSA